MEQEIRISRHFYKKWYREAKEQNVHYLDAGNFFSMKERRYREFILSREEEKKAIEREKYRRSLYTDDSMTHLSKLGQQVALAEYLKIPKTKRIINSSRFDFEDLQKQYAKVSKGKADKENFIWDLDHWYKKLKSDMKEYRWSKETLSSYGLDFKAATKFYFAAREIAAGC